MNRNLTSENSSNETVGQLMYPKIHCKCKEFAELLWRRLSNTIVFDKSSFWAQNYFQYINFHFRWSIFATTSNHTSNKHAPQDQVCQEKLSIVYWINTHASKVVSQINWEEVFKSYMFTFQMKKLCFYGFHGSSKTCRFTTWSRIHLCNLRFLLSYCSLKRTCKILY